MKKELANVLGKTCPDVITFSDLGESTLAKNMDLAIEVIKKITNIPLVVITNSNLMKNKNV